MKHILNIVLTVIFGIMVLSLLIALCSQNEFSSTTVIGFIIPLILFGSALICCIIKLVKHKMTRSNPTKEEIVAVTVTGAGISCRQTFNTKPSKAKNCKSKTNQPSVNGIEVKANRKKNFVPILITFLSIIVILIVIIVNFCAKPPENKANTTSHYSPIELLTLQDHPHLFESVESVQRYYDKIGDSRVQIITNAQQGRMRINCKSYTSEENVLYIIKDGEKVNHLEFYIISPEAASLNDKDVAKIVLGYLPDGFLDYYKTDCAFISGNDDIKIYTYSARLDGNNKEKYAEAKSKGYPFYFHFKIFNHKNELFWRGETGFSAYGGVDKGKADNFPKWDITV